MAENTPIWKIIVGMGVVVSVFTGIIKYDERLAKCRDVKQGMEQLESKVAQTLDKFHKVDILVNNAGVIKMSPAETTKEEDWDNVIDVNLKGEFLCAQEVGVQMINQRSGKIINIASVAGKMPPLRN